MSSLLFLLLHLRYNHHKTDFIMNKSNVTIARLLSFAAILVLILFASCTTTRKTVSPYAWQSKVNEIEDAIQSLPHEYLPVGFGSEVINDIIVTGRRSNDVGGYDTLMDNDPATYANFVFQDSLGNYIDFVLKRKEKTDIKGKKYIYNIEVAQCNCSDRNIFYYICSPSGIVQSATLIAPDQKSVFYDWTKIGLIGVGAVVVSAIIVEAKVSSLEPPRLTYP